MNNATQRPTAAQLYNARLKAERKAAAAERRAERLATGSNEVVERRRLYMNVG